MRKGFSGRPFPRGFVQTLLQTGFHFSRVSPLPSLVQKEGPRQEKIRKPLFSSTSHVPTRFLPNPWETNPFSCLKPKNLRHHPGG